MCARASHPGDDAHQAQSYLDQLGLTGEEDPAHLSGGEARRTALARVLAPAPDILLLDEADQPSRSHDHRMAGSRIEKLPFRAL
jgi:ABC-type sulfate/molybdate transport systems ATPase subunit